MPASINAGEDRKEITDGWINVGGVPRGIIEGWLNVGGVAESIFASFTPQDVIYTLPGTYTLDIGRANRVYISGRAGGGGGGGGSGAFGAAFVSIEDGTFWGHSTTRSRQPGVNGNVGEGTTLFAGTQELLGLVGGRAGTGANSSTTPVTGSTQGGAPGTEGAGSGGADGPGRTSTGSFMAYGLGIVTIHYQFNGGGGSAGLDGYPGEATLAEMEAIVVPGSNLTISVGAGGDGGAGGLGSQQTLKFYFGNSNNLAAVNLPAGNTGGRGTDGADGWVRIRTARE